MGWGIGGRGAYSFLDMLRLTDFLVMFLPDPEPKPFGKILQGIRDIAARGVCRTDVNTT